jgi:hypothetical protein
MKFIKYSITIIFTMIMSILSGQYQVSMYVSGNVAGETSGNNYSLLLVTGQNVIGPVEEADNNAYLGLLAPIRYIFTGVELYDLKKTKLFQNYPNPFKTNTIISFVIAKQGKVELTVYDILGHPVKVLLNKQLPAGKHEVIFNATNVSQGLFFYRMDVDNFQKTKSMVLIR